MRYMRSHIILVLAELGLTTFQNYDEVIL